MRLIIDGYNLLHVGRSLALSSDDLQRERDHLIEQLSSYRQTRPCEITVVFDGWQGGWPAEKKERRKGIEVIFSRLGETADEVIKRLLKERGPGTVLITSDREISRYAEKTEAAVIPSDQFRERMELSADAIQKGVETGEEEGRESKRKGPSRQLSKKEKRAKAALKKL